MDEIKTGEKMKLSQGALDALGELVPQHDHGALLRYFENRIQPGGFLVCVLSNDLKEACLRADRINRAALVDIVNWLYNYAPSSAWGSPERVTQWLTPDAEAIETD